MGISEENPVHQRYIRSHFPSGRCTRDSHTYLTEATIISSGVDKLALLHYKNRQSCHVYGVVKLVYVIINNQEQIHVHVYTSALGLNQIKGHPPYTVKEDFYARVN